MNDRFATKYDGLVQEQNWHGPEILFGMMFEYIRSGEKLLDIGIGTGLSAVAFHKTGVLVYGLDYSYEMLSVCKQKNIAADLIQFDLNDSPLPYPDHFFDHISANAVLYFIERLENLFSEISRILKKKGTWAFIIQTQTDRSKKSISANPPGKNALKTFKHSREYIIGLLEKNSFNLVKELDFISKNFQMEGKPVSFTLFVARS